VGRIGIGLLTVLFWAHVLFGVLVWYFFVVVLV
jgi:hypothetical protein